MVYLIFEGTASPWNLLSKLGVDPFDCDPQPTVRPPHSGTGFPLRPIAASLFLAVNFSPHNESPPLFAWRTYMSRFKKPVSYFGPYVHHCLSGTCLVVANGGVFPRPVRSFARGVFFYRRFLWTSSIRPPRHENLLLFSVLPAISFFPGLQSSSESLGAPLE